MFVLLKLGSSVNCPSWIKWWFKRVSRQANLYTMVNLFFFHSIMSQCSLQYCMLIYFLELSNGWLLGYRTLNQSRVANIFSRLFSNYLNFLFKNTWQFPRLFECFSCRSIHSYSVPPNFELISFFWHITLLTFSRNESIFEEDKVSSRSCRLPRHFCRRLLVFGLCLT